nr:RNA-directed DNA polymerase, eukaryota, reverse transcriptase zinc-binding domain protein [Tanacetum cinerariifolium]
MLQGMKFVWLFGVVGRINLLVRTDIRSNSLGNIGTSLAYDSVRWDFLLDVLQAFGFGPNWCKWIRGISLNGKSSISHLFYADDAMFVGEWSEDNLKITVSILKCFFFASGLKINFHKSQVLGVGVPHYLVEQAANSIGCSIMDKYFRYLGVKVKTLSIGGRLTLLKSVLGASPIYNMSIYKVPKGVLKTMESIRNSFFNGADPLNKKITWAAWNKVLAAKKNGGLGVSSFHALNHALLLKWVWRFISQDGSLWYRVIQAIHGPSIKSHASQVSSSWCSILWELEVLKSKGFNFLSHCFKRIGDGCQVRFWQDRWLAGMFGIEWSANNSLSWSPCLSLFPCRRLRIDGVVTYQATLSSELKIFAISVGFLWTHFHVIFVKLLKNLFTIPCFNVPWPSLCSVRFVDCGICLGKICRRFHIGLPGSQLSVSLISLRRCWKVFSILRGGLFGCFVIVLSLMLRLQDDRLSLMILFLFLHLVF